MSVVQNHCKFFVQRKKRYCKMLVKPDKEYCGEHQFEDSNSSSNNGLRIACPLDPKHTVYASKLNKHLKICNARQTAAEPYISKDINAGLSEVEESILTHNSSQTLSEYPEDQILDVIKKVQKIYEKTIRISDKKLSFPEIEKEMEKPECGDKAKKHLKQASAILGFLEQYQMLKDNTCFIEFGAGRGQLGCWIVEATERFENCKVFLVEKASPKHKRDNKLARSSDRIQRIRADIADLVLEKLEPLNEVENVVGVTKHLCGAATDLTIRCLTRPKFAKNAFSGILLTFCCHHRCSWTTYIGKKFFSNNDLTIEDFRIICGLSSWATCGSGFSREYREKLKNNGKEEALEGEKYGLTRAERENVGRKCKNLINWGRLSFLEECGFTCSLHYYVDKEVTLENVCIVATRQKN